MAIWTPILGCGTVDVGSNPNHAQSGGSDDVSFRTLFLEDFRSWLFEHKELIVGGYLSALVLLAYPAAFVILWMQLAHHYGFGYGTALYAASLVPTTFVFGKVPLLIVMSLAANAAVGVWTMFGWGWKVFSPIFLPDDSPGFRGYKVTLGKVAFYYFRFAQLMMPFMVPLLFFSMFPFSWFALGVYLAFLSLCLVGAFFAAPLPTRVHDDQSARRFYVVVVVAFIWSVLAAIPLAGLLAPGLQTVELGSGDDKRKVALLSNANGYWHVIDHDRTITSIPDDEAGTVRVLQGATRRPYAASSGGW